MMTVLIILHMIICLLLIGIILIQAGRGGGLVEGFSGVESMFGTKTSSFLTRTTTILAVLFFITCLSLAILSARQGKSLVGKVKPQAPIKVDVSSKIDSTPKPEAAVKQDSAPKTEAAPAAETPAQTQASEASPKPETAK